jgi:hypothetical protein
LTGGGFSLQLPPAIGHTSDRRIIIKSLFHCEARLAETNQLPFGLVTRSPKNKAAPGGEREYLNARLESRPFR